jgi:hypothetical protein
VNNDFLKWAALAAALVATASAEYEVARAVGFNEWVAAAVPGALDVYTVRAMRAHRDVLTAVVAMILVNAASHLVSAGLLPVNVPLVVAVSAIAPLVLWRVHALRVEDVHTVETPAEYVEPVKVERVPETYPELPEPVPAVPEAVPTGVRLLPIVARPEVTVDVIHSENDQRVLAADEPRTRPEVRAGDVPDWTVSGTYADEPEYPDPLIPRVRADFPDEIPGVRRLKETYSIGQPRAQRIRDELAGVSS